MKRSIISFLAIMFVAVSIFSFSSCKKNKNKNNSDTPSEPVTQAPSHTHTVATAEAKAKTCTENGWAAYEYCTECDYTTKALIPAGHVIANGSAKAKTCTEDGWSAYEYCTECDYTTKEIIPAGHVIANCSAKAKTCTEDGWAAYEYCTECDYTTKALIPAGHVIANGSAKVKTCTEDGWAAYEYCTECDYTTKEVIPAGHVIANGAAKTKTCTEDGWAAYEYCTECTYTTKVVISATGHQLVTDPYVEATNKSTGLTEGQHCGVCGLVTVKQKALYYLNVSVKNASYGIIGSYTKSHEANEKVVLTATADSERSFCAWYLIKYNSNGTVYYEKITDQGRLEYTMPKGTVEILAVFSQHENTDIWMGDMATEFSAGSGTKDDPFIIRSGAELNLLGYRVNNRLKQGSDYYQSMYYRLDRSIDLSEHEWTPIGTSVTVNNNAASFKGTFDGNGNVIYGLRITGEVTTNHVGLFGYCESGTTTVPTVKNLTFEVVTIKITYSGTKDLYVGVLAGEGAKCFENIFVISNLQQPVEINVRCTNDKAIYVGGLIGDNSISNTDFVTVEFNGSINVKGNADVYVGGLMGKLTSNMKLKDSYANCNITCEGKTVYAGGFAGKIANCNLSSCYHTGEIKVTSTADAYVGGLVGENSSNSSIYLYDSYHQGGITVSAGGSAEVSGLVTHNLDSVEKCYVLGNITVNTVSSAYVAGLAKGTTDETHVNLYYIGNITVVCSGKYCHVGGLFYSYASVTNAYAKGYMDVTADNNLVSVRCGGITANSISTDLIENCVSMMTIDMKFTGTKTSYKNLFTDCGLVSGKNSGIDNCYAYDSITLNGETYEHKDSKTVVITDMAMTSTEDFYTVILGWKKADWNFTLSDTPTLIVTKVVAV